MAGITDQGYQIKTQNEWFEEQKALYQAIDPLWNLDPSAPDGIKLASDAETFASLDEIGQRAYNSKDPNKATGNDLDIVASITGALRDAGTPSDVALNLSGTNGTIIADGALVESTDGSQWAINGPVTISGVTAATATALVNGPTQASIGSITKIVNAQAGWASVTNPSVATPGTAPETDSELRVKRRLGVSLPGQNQVDSTFAVIANLGGVRRVRIYENDSISPADTNGLPVHSTAIIVDGGDNQEIADAIYSKRNPGPIQFQLSNPVTVAVVSVVTGNSKDITFNRPNYVDITVAYNIVDGGDLPSDIEQVIKDATLEYVDGTLLAAGSGFNRAGFGIGETVHSGRFYTPANSVIGQFPGSYITSITVNAGSSVAISFEELSRYTDANISVVLT